MLYGVGGPISSTGMVDRKSLYYIVNSCRYPEKLPERVNIRHWSAKPINIFAPFRREKVMIACN